MYGQMTAGSWIYIGTQGILQGTYETLAELARRHFGGSLAGRLVVTAGLGGMGGAQPLAVTMNGGIALVVEVDPARIERRLATTLRRRARDRSRRCARSRRRVAGGRRRAIDCARRERRRCPPRARAPGPDARRRHRPDVGARRAERIRTQRPEPCATPRRCAARIPRSTPAARWPQWPNTCARCCDSSATAPSPSTTATTFARKPFTAASPNAFDIPGFVPEYIRPLFCRGKGPFRWAALSGDPADIEATDTLALEMFKERRGAVPMDPAGARARRVPGPAGADLLARVWRASAVRPRHQRSGPPRRRQGADRHRPRSPRRRLGRVAQSRNRGHARWQRCHRRLAGPQRPAQYRFWRHLGLDAPWRRRRDRLLSARRHGRRGRWIARGRREAAARADVRPRARGRAPRGCWLSGRNRHGAPLAASTCRRLEDRDNDDSGASVPRAARADRARRHCERCAAHSRRARRLWHRTDVAAPARPRPSRTQRLPVHRRRADCHDPGAAVSGDPGRLAVCVPDKSRRRARRRDRSCSVRRHARLARHRARARRCAGDVPARRVPRAADVREFSRDCARCCAI